MSQSQYIGAYTGAEIDEGIGKALASGKKLTVRIDGAVTEYDGTQAKTVIVDTSGKVDKVAGKALSANDYTDAEKTKLAGIASGAQVNTIGTVKLNGTSLTPDANKAVNITPSISDVSGLTDALSGKEASGTAASAVSGHNGSSSAHSDIREAVAAKYTKPAGGIPLSDIWIAQNAGAHNSIYRGVCLGTSVSDDQLDAIAAGTFDGMYIGDYWLINDIIWRIAAFDYWFNTGVTTNSALICNAHHVVIVPDQLLLPANSSSRWMNDTATTSAGYTGTKFRNLNDANSGVNQCKTIINNAFGSGHILTYYDRLCTSASNGYESAGGWTACSVELMSEIMVYGHTFYRNSRAGTNIPQTYDVGATQFPLFFFNPSLIANTGAYWLRDVVSDDSFAMVFGARTLYWNSANTLNTGIRPFFSICAAQSTTPAA